MEVDPRVALFRARPANLMGFPDPPRGRGTRFGHVVFTRRLVTDREPLRDVVGVSIAGVTNAHGIVVSRAEEARHLPGERPDVGDPVRDLHHLLALVHQVQGDRRRAVPRPVPPDGVPPVRVPHVTLGRLRHAVAARGRVEDREPARLSERARVVTVAHADPVFESGRRRVRHHPTGSAIVRLVRGDRPHHHVVPHQVQVHPVRTCPRLEPLNVLQAPRTPDVRRTWHGHGVVARRLGRPGPWEAEQRDGRNRGGNDTRPRTHHSVPLTSRPRRHSPTSTGPQGISRIPSSTILSGRSVTRTIR
jgi:hypothetical protein